MRIEQLRYLVEVAKQKSISKAAESLYIAQSSLSSQISLLERELDVELFERTNKGVYLTEVGKLIEEKAEHILKEISELTAISQHYTSPHPFSETLEIGFTHDLFQKTLLDCNLQIIEKHPDARISTTIFSLSDCLQAIKTHQIHIGLITYMQFNTKKMINHLQDNQIGIIPLFTEKNYLIIHKDNPAYKTGHTFSDIDFHNQRIFRKRKFSLDSPDDEFLQLKPKMEKNTNSFVAIDSIIEVLNYIQHNKGIAVYPANIIAENWHLFDNNMRLIPNDKNDINLAFIYDKEIKLTALQQSFINTYTYLYQENHINDIKIIETLLRFDS